MKMKTRQKSQKGHFRSPFYGNESGIILVVVIMFVAILALLGAVSVLSISTDLKISSNYKTSKQAAFNAHAGMAEAKGRLRGRPPVLGGVADNQYYAGDVAAGDVTAPDIDENWIAYIYTSAAFDPAVFDKDDYNLFGAQGNIYFPVINDYASDTQTVNTAQNSPSMIYGIKIRHKREWDAVNNGHKVLKPHYADGDGIVGTGYIKTQGDDDLSKRGNIIYYGFSNGGLDKVEQFTTMTAVGTVYRPVEIVTVFGKSSGSTFSIEEEVAINPGISVASAVYSEMDFVAHGKSIEVSGHDLNTCVPTMPSVPSVYTVDTPGNKVKITPPADDDSVSFNPPIVEDGPAVVDIEKYIKILKRGAITIHFGNGSDIPNNGWGDPDDYKTFYSETSGFGNTQLSLSNINGYGNLLIDGDLKLGGNVDWHGLILVTGDVTLGGGGKLPTNVFGAIVAGNVEGLQGKIRVRYSSCDLFDSVYAAPLNELTWKNLALVP